MGGCLHWVVREGFSKEGMFKQTFEYENNLPQEGTRILLPRKMSAQALRKK